MTHKVKLGLGMQKAKIQTEIPFCLTAAVFCDIAIHLTRKKVDLKLEKREK